MTRDLWQQYDVVFARAGFHLILASLDGYKFSSFAAPRICFPSHLLLLLLHSLHSPPATSTLQTTAMHFLPLVSLAALALAAPHEKRLSCVVSQQWAVQGFSSFTADPSPTGVSHISFTFSDPNTSTSSLCSRSLAPGSGSSPADPNHFYPCQDPAMQYQFDGTKLSLKHTFNCAGLVCDIPLKTPRNDRHVDTDEQRN